MWIYFVRFILKRPLCSNYLVLFPVLFFYSNRHDLIKKLYTLKDNNSELAGLLLEQVQFPVFVFVCSGANMASSQVDLLFMKI